MTLDKVTDLVEVALEVVVPDTAAVRHALEVEWVTESTLLALAIKSFIDEYEGIGVEYISLRFNGYRALFDAVSDIRMANMGVMPIDLFERGHLVLMRCRFVPPGSLFVELAQRESRCPIQKTQCRQILTPDTRYSWK
ncbi:hypothetical protein ACLPJK_26140 [Pseudomonas aeruginosa]|uniref:hypothetical protein n=1 Tax=Pseudomonas aeruginosa TaxID=287 RepID=UPI003D266273